MVDQPTTPDQRATTLPAILPVDVLLRAARHSADLSQRELASRAGVAPATVGRIESGAIASPGYRLLHRLLSAADCRLTAVNAAGATLQPRPYDDVVDKGRRRYPAHLDVRPVIHEWDWWFGLTRPARPMSLLTSWRLPCTPTPRRTLMRTLIVTEFITLDGVVEAPGGEPTHPHAGWTRPYGTAELYGFKFKETMEAESLLLGRVTYEGFAAAWPTMDDEFAQKMNAMPKHVVTSTLTELGWNSTVLAGDMPTAVAELKAGDGGPILVAGSATLVRSLLAYGLVDELRLIVYPVLIGGGLSIWPTDRAKVGLELVELQRYHSGATLQVFRVG